ncbi:hypothetical protein NQ314_004879 [Rhamnusium bicolor]|uniref:Uncharacterized protein n=1 Tax=Rhamnusium bicolor TaxID=1586634 RepID=A0AAV8ZIN8_9CUCU|nr:hypothetical protein NQ314_004879 [Rhamnusium bicolor]
MAAVKTEVKEENEEDRENEIEIDEEVDGENTDAAKKKKKRKRRKNKVSLKENYEDGLAEIGDANNAENTLLENGVTENEAGDGEKKKKKRNRKKGGKPVETSPPSIPIVDLFSDGVFPLGEIQEYPVNKDNRTAKDRFTSEEKTSIR